MYFTKQAIKDENAFTTIGALNFIRIKCVYTQNNTLKRKLSTRFILFDIHKKDIIANLTL